MELMTTVSKKKRIFCNVVTIGSLYFPLEMGYARSMSYIFICGFIDMTHEMSWSHQFMINIPAFFIKPQKITGQVRRYRCTIKGSVRWKYPQVRLAPMVDHILLQFASRSLKRIQFSKVWMRRCPLPMLNTFQVISTV